MSAVTSMVTVVIPVWDDYVDFLTEAVESVRRNATETPIVVVDNASTVTVPELEGCEIVRSARRLSEGGARNLGLQSVTTPYVVFLDADDMLLDGALQYMVSLIDGDSSVAVSGTAILDGKTGERHRNPRRFAARLASRPRLFAVADSVWSLLPIQGCVVMRTDQVREAGGYSDADLGEDWDLAAALTWRGRIEFSERLGLYYRRPEPVAARPARTSGDLRASASRVRARMRTDPAIPGWARALLPAIAVLQLGAIHVARPLYLARRRIARTRRSGTETP